MERLPDAPDAGALAGAPTQSSKNAVAAVGLGVRKVVMKGKDPIHAAQHFLEENPTDFVVLAAHTHNGRMRWGRGKVMSQPIASASEAAALFVPYGSEGFIILAPTGTRH